MFEVMGHVVKISVSVSGFLWTPPDSVVLVVLFCLHILLVTRKTRKEIEEFCSFSIVN